MPEFLPEVDESTANSEIHSIYSEIKQLWGVDSPALVFRSVATLPGALAWSWEQLRPLAVAGLIQREGIELSAMLPRPVVSPLTSAALETIGISQSSVALIRAAIAAYNRANPSNLIA